MSTAQGLNEPVLPSFVEAPIVQMPSSGEILQIELVRLRILTDSGMTRGAWSMLEYYAPPDFRGPILHRHQKTQETFYVLSGTLTFTLEGDTGSAPPGSCIVVPPGVSHSFVNLEPVPVTFLMLFTPGGMEGFYRELSALHAQTAQWPPADENLVPNLRKRYDIIQG